MIGPHFLYKFKALTKIAYKLSNNYKYCLKIEQKDSIDALPVFLPWYWAKSVPDIRKKFEVPVFNIYTFIEWFQSGLLPTRFNPDHDDPRK